MAPVVTGVRRGGIWGQAHELLACVLPAVWKVRAPVNPGRPVSRRSGKSGGKNSFPRCKISEKMQKYGYFCGNRPEQVRWWVILAFQVV